MISETTSRGTQQKIFKNDRIYKFNHFGYEDIAEVLVSRLEAFVCGIDYIDYNFDCIDNKPVCYSNSFKLPGCQEITLYRLLNYFEDFSALKMSCSGKEYMNLIEDRVFQLTGLNIHGYLAKIIKLDSITLNEDRHLNNISVRRMEKGGFEVMPIYDNGMSLLADIKRYPLSIGYNFQVGMVKARPFDDSFKQQVELFQDAGLLKIDIEAFYKDLTEAEAGWYRFFDGRSQMYERAKGVLLSQLERMEGISWVRR